MISQVAKKYPQLPEPPLQEHMAGLPYHPSSLPENFTLAATAPIVVRTEEAVIVVLVLILWAAAIALFFNRWGKIRMLEPYQPKFIQQHRPSCPLVESVQLHRSFSKYNLNPLGAGTTTTAGITSPPHALRPRQNSVFVGSSMVTLPFNATRRVRSAVDLQNLQYLLLSDPALNRHPHIQEYRRSSMLCGLERVQCHPEPDRRRSSVFDQRRSGLLTDVPRRSSVFVDCEKALHPPHRRASTLTGCGDPERGFIPPRPSGVLDFRRNSMLIINNLTEEVPPFQPCLRTLNISHMNLPHEFQQQQQQPIRRHSMAPAKSLNIKSKSLSTEKYATISQTNQKSARSLDLEAGNRKCSTPVSELRRQFLLNTESPMIVETRCSTPGANNETCLMNGVAEEEVDHLFTSEEDDPENDGCRQQVRITTGLEDVNATSVITSANLQSIVKSTNV